jgi:hypothetical protein
VHNVKEPTTRGCVAVHRSHLGARFRARGVSSDREPLIRDQGFRGFGSQIGGRRRPEYLHVVPGGDAVQQFRCGISGRFGCGQLLKNPSMAAGEKRLSFLPGTAETTLKVCGVFRGT